MDRFKLAKGHELITIPSFVFMTLSIIVFGIQYSKSSITNIDYFLLFGSIIFFIFIVQFFRDPTRFPDSVDPLHVYSPADGVLFEIDTSSEPGKTIFRIRMRFWDMHVNYMPINGTLISQYKKRGSFLPILPGLNKISKNKNARQIMEFKSDFNFNFIVIQISGIVAYRTVSYIKPEMKIKMLERIGMIRFGSETDLNIPSSKIIVKSHIGQKVKAGKTQLATLQLD